MFCIFKHLKAMRNSLIVCLMWILPTSRENFRLIFQNGGGTPPLKTAPFFSPSPEAGVNFLKKNRVFLNWYQRERVGVQGAGLGFEDERRF